MILIFLYLIYFLIFLSISDRDFFFRKEHLSKGLSLVSSDGLINFLILKMVRYSISTATVISLISERKRLILIFQGLGNIHET